MRQNRKKYLKEFKSRVDFEDFKVRLTLVQNRRYNFNADYSEKKSNINKLMP